MLNVFFFCISSLLIDHCILIERLAEGARYFSLCTILSTGVSHCSPFSTGFAVSFAVSQVEDSGFDAAR